LITDFRQIFQYACGFPAPQINVPPVQRRSLVRPLPHSIQGDQATGRQARGRKNDGGEKSKKTSVLGKDAGSLQIRNFRRMRGVQASVRAGHPVYGTDEAAWRSRQRRSLRAHPLFQVTVILSGYGYTFMPLPLRPLTVQGQGKRLSGGERIVSCGPFAAFVCAGGSDGTDDESDIRPFLFRLISRDAAKAVPWYHCSMENRGTEGVPWAKRNIPAR
jgi:hypothetical protein